MANCAFEDIVDTFDFLDDWEDRYRHLIDMGRALPLLDAALKTDATKVDGCASQVWLYCTIDGTGPEAIITFDGDSDAIIVKGLIAVLQALYSGQTAGDITNTDALAQFQRLGLDQALSSQRSNGLRAMVQTIRTLAAETCA